MVMRPSTLRALLREMRAGGVSEFSETVKGRSLSIRLGAPPSPVPSAKVDKPAAKATGTLTKAETDLLKELEVTKDELLEVVGRVS